MILVSGQFSEKEKSSVLVPLSGHPCLDSWFCDLSLPDQSQSWLHVALLCPSHGSILCSGLLPGDSDMEGVEDDEVTRLLLQTPLPRSISIRRLAVGEQHAIACSSEGGVWGWGWNAMGACGLGREVLSTREPLPLASPFGNIVKVSSVSAGLQHSLLLSEEGDVYSCGSNGDGQLGLGDRTARFEAELISALTLSVSTISCGGRHSLALCQDNGSGHPRCYSWGYNEYGQLGVGDEHPRSIPTEVQLPDPHYKFVDLKGGRWHSVFKLSALEV